MQHFINATDARDIHHLIRRALAFKAQPRHKEHLGKGKVIGLVFLNPSTRTRMSTQIAARNLGMEAIVFNAATEGWALEFEPDAIMNGNTVEHIREAAAVMGEYCDIVAVRSFPALKNAEDDRADRIIKAYMAYSNKPVLSLESAVFHPLQSLADLVTIEENRPKGRKPKVVLTWAPHIKALPHCVPNSFAQWVNAWGEADFVIAHPEGHDLDPSFVEGAVVTADQAAALEGADFIYVKNWSASQPYGQVTCTDTNWMLTPEKLNNTPNARVMHCLPVRRNVELSSAILDSPQSIVIEQAGNRVWAAQAVLESMLL
jgi:N-succinyl-L-ornithine transcarbamylase